MRTRYDSRDLDSASRETLYEMAKERAVEGRSAMSEDQLRAALSEPATSQPVGSRVEQFRLLAEASARGELVMLPQLLTGRERRMHVRRTIREDHQVRIAQHAEDAQLKFEKLAGSLFSFFRGTALLFYRDMAGQDDPMPTVLALGDVHPENFGIMPNTNNVPVFSVNDFDEACYAPFTWDLRRGATGFMVAADEVGGCSRKKQRKIAARFVRGYIAGIRRFAEEPTEQDHETRLDNAPKLIRDLIKAALQDRAEWLADDYLASSSAAFVPARSWCPWPAAATSSRS